MWSKRLYWSPPSFPRLFYAYFMSMFIIARKQGQNTKDLIFFFFIILKQHYSCCSDSVYMLVHISILISQLLMFNSNSNLHLILRNSFALPLLYNGKGKCSLECSSSPCGLTTKDLD